MAGRAFSRTHVWMTVSEAEKATGHSDGALRNMAARGVLEKGRDELNRVILRIPRGLCRETRAPARPEPGLDRAAEAQALLLQFRAEKAGLLSRLEALEEELRATADRLTKRLDAQSARLNRVVADPDGLMRFFDEKRFGTRDGYIAKPFIHVAGQVMRGLPAGPERAVVLRRLLEAMEAALRAGQEAVETVVGSDTP
jgi:hypothetical protein